MASVSKYQGILTVAIGFSLVGYSEHLSSTQPTRTAPRPTVDEATSVSNPDLESSEVYKEVSQGKDLDEKAILLQKAKPEDLQDLKKLLKPPLSQSDKELLETIKATLKMKDFTLREAFLFEPTTPAEESAQKALLENLRLKTDDQEYKRMREYARLTKKTEKQNREIRANKPHPDPAAFPPAELIPGDNSSKTKVEKLTHEKLEKMVSEKGTSQGEIFIRRPKDLKEDRELQSALNRAGLSLTNDGYVLKMVLNKENKDRFLDIVNSSGLGSNLEKLIVPAKEAEAQFSKQIKGWGKTEQTAADLFTVVPSKGDIEAKRIYNAGPGKGDVIYPGAPQPRFSPRDYGDFMAEVFQNFGDTFKDYTQQRYEYLKYKTGKEPSTTDVAREVVQDLREEKKKGTDPLVELAAASFYKAPPSQISLAMAPPIVSGFVRAESNQVKLRQAASDYTPYVPYVKPFVGGYPDFSQFLSELAKGTTRKQSP